MKLFFYAGWKFVIFLHVGNCFFHDVEIVFVIMWLHFLSWRKNCSWSIIFYFFEKKNWSRQKVIYHVEKNHIHDYFWKQDCSGKRITMVIIFEESALWVLKKNIFSRCLNWIFWPEGPPSFFWGRGAWVGIAFLNEKECQMLEIEKMKK